LDKQEKQEQLTRSVKRPRRKFSDGFKRDAVEIVTSSGKPIAQVARELGIYDSTLGNWVKQDEINRGVRDGVTTTEREEIVALRRENAHLRMERELLKRAVAFWVRESDE
jgi:transposase-like protein